MVGKFKGRENQPHQLFHHQAGRAPMRGRRVFWKTCARTNFRDNSRQPPYPGGWARSKPPMTTKPRLLMENVHSVS